MTKDRRIRKTRAILKSTLIEIMTQKSIKHITVKEICEIADLNRGTFYLHYRDVYDMLEKIEEEFFDELTKIIESHKGEITNDKKPLLKDLFSFSKNNKSFCKAMLSEHGDIGFMRKLLKYLYSEMQSLYGKNSSAAEHSCYFIIYGCIGLIENWLQTGAKETPEEMAILAEEIIMDGISKYIKKENNNPLNIVIKTY